MKFLPPCSANQEGRDHDMATMGTKQEGAGIFVCTSDGGALDQLTDPRNGKSPETQNAIARARSWTATPGIRPAPATVVAVVGLLLDHIDGLTKIATGELRHVYNGECPDQVEGSKVRDPDCPACQVLLAAKDVEP